MEKFEKSDFFGIKATFLHIQNSHYKFQLNVSNTVFCALSRGIFSFLNFHLFQKLKGKNY